MTPAETPPPVQTESPLSGSDEAFIHSLENYASQVSLLSTCATALTPRGLLKAQAAYAEEKEKVASQNRNERRKDLKGGENQYHIVPVRSRPADPRWGNVFNEPGEVDAEAIRLHQEAFHAEVDAIIERRSSSLVQPMTGSEKLQIIAKSDQAEIQRLRNSIQEHIPAITTQEEQTTPVRDLRDDVGTQIGKEIGWGIADLARTVSRGIRKADKNPKKDLVVSVPPPKLTPKLVAPQKPPLRDHDSNGQLTPIPLTAEGAVETRRRVERIFSEKGGMNEKLRQASSALSNLEKDLVLIEEKGLDKDIETAFLIQKGEIEAYLRVLNCNAYGAEWVTSPIESIVSKGFRVEPLSRNSPIPDGSPVMRVEQVGMISNRPDANSVNAILVFNVGGKEVQARVIHEKSVANPNPPDKPKLDETDDEGPDKSKSPDPDTDDDEDKPEKDVNTFACPDCGAHNPEGSIVCRSCGGRFVQVTDILKPKIKNNPALPVSAPPPSEPDWMPEDEGWGGKIKRAGGIFGGIVQSALGRNRGGIPTQVNWDALSANAAEILPPRLDSKDTATEAEVFRKYADAREKYLEWAKEVTREGSDSDILRLYKKLGQRDFTGREWTEIFEAPYAATYLGQNERERPMQFIALSVSYIQHLDEQSANKQISEASRDTLKEIRTILVRKIEELTGGHFITEGTSHDIYPGIVTDTTINQWDTEGYQVDFSGTNPVGEPRFYRMKGYGFYPAEQVARDTLAKKVEIEYLSDAEERDLEVRQSAFDELGGDLVKIIDRKKINIKSIDTNKDDIQRYSQNKESIKSALQVEKIRQILVNSLYSGHDYSRFEQDLYPYLVGSTYFEVSKRLGTKSEPEMDQVDLNLLVAYKVINAIFRGGDDLNPPDEAVRQKMALALGIEYAPMPINSTQLPPHL